MEPNPYEAPREAVAKGGSRSWTAVKALGWALVILLPTNCLSFFGILVAIETPYLDVWLARTAFWITVLLTVTVFMALVISVVARSLSR